MCGIASIYHAKKPISKTLLRELAHSMRLRGPDGHGIWLSDNACHSQVHTRLAIIDLDDRAAQPMEHPKSDWILNFNGEIYNYQDLRKELITQGAQFRTESDSEVILLGIDMHGSNFIKKLRGMFAFTLFNKNDHRVIAARDAFGIKPLYHSATHEGVFFASSVKTLCIALKSMGISPTKSATAAALFLQWGSIEEPYTSYEEIRSVPAGCVLEIAANGEEELKYFFDLAHELTCATKEHISQRDFERFIKESIHYHMTADVEVGVFLSAGLDSATIAAIANSRQPETIHGITLGFNEHKDGPNDEVPLAREIAKKIGIKHSVHYVNEREFADVVDHYFEVMDQPSIDGLNTYLVSKSAADAGLKCVLSGLGGDELLGGYPFSGNLNKMRTLAPLFKLTKPVLDAFASRDFIRYKISALGHANTSLDFYKAQRGIFTPAEFERFLPKDNAAKLNNALNSAKSDNFDYDALNPFSASALLESKYFMRNQLLKDSDWASMANSLELRVPLVDTVLWGQCAKGWTNDKTTPRKSWLPKCYDGQWPENFSNRPKTGFITPINHWLQKRSNLQNWRTFSRLEHDRHHWAQRWCAEMFIRNFEDVL